MGLSVGDGIVGARAVVLVTLFCKLPPRAAAVLEVIIFLEGNTIRGTMGANGLISMRDGRL